MGGARMSRVDMATAFCPCLDLEGEAMDRPSRMSCEREAEVTWSRCCSSLLGEEA